MSSCVFDTFSTKCIEHGGRYDGSRGCEQKPVADRLEAKITKLQRRHDERIAKLQRRRDAMRLVWGRPNTWAKESTHAASPERA